MKPATTESAPYSRVFDEFSSAVDSFKLDDPCSGYELELHLSVIVDNCLTGMREGMPCTDPYMPAAHKRKYNHTKFRSWCIEIHRVVKLFYERIINPQRALGKMGIPDAIHLRNCTELISKKWKEARDYCAAVKYRADFTIEYLYAENDVEVTHAKRTPAGFEVIEEVVEEEEES